MITIKDYKIFQAILNIIQLFELKKIDFFSLVNDLDSFYRELSDVDEKWSESFFNNWMNLESVNSDIIESNKNEIPMIYSNLINQSLQEIKQITEDLLNNDLNQNDLSISNKVIEINNNWLMCPFCKEAWKSRTTSRFVRCPKCNNKMHNPRYKK